MIDANGTGVGYAYGPSIIFTDDGTGPAYHAYACAGDYSGAGWDVIRHTQTADLKTWSPSQIVRQTNPQSGQLSECDPSVVRFNAGDGLYYYLFLGGGDGNIYVSRSVSASGPFLQYTARHSWEANPVDPQIVAAHAASFSVNGNNGVWYGAGEPSVVVLNGKLYMWYTDDTYDAPARNFHVLLRTANNPTSWSAPQLTTIPSADSISVDVKYDAVNNRFMLFGLENQISTTSQLIATTSIDGVNWGGSQVFCDSNCLPHYAGNVGVSGDDSGHLIGSTAMLAFGAPYQLNGGNCNGTSCWGQWSLWGGLLQLSPIANSSYLNFSSITNQVIGWIDGAFGGASPYFAGWACSIGMTQSIQIAIYLGDSSGQPTIGLGWATANQASEPQVSSSCGSTGTAYRFSIPLSAAQISQYAGQSIFVYAISPFQVGNSQIGQSGKFAVPNPGIPGIASSEAKVYRFYIQSAGQHFFTTNYSEGANAGFTFEAASFPVFNSQEAGTAPIYRCYTGTSHFISRDSGCESFKNEGLYGYIYAAQTNGAVPLYRFYNNGDNLVTENYNEGAAAGYQFVTTLGWVPPR